MTHRIALVAVLLVAGVSVSASGPVGIYGIVQKVVFEPNQPKAERIQVWGAFAYADLAGSSGFSPVRRGYMYFTLPGLVAASENPTLRQTIRTEWSDLKAVAGTNEAVAFGRWGYIASFTDLDPERAPVAPSLIYQNRPGGGDASDLRVRPASESPANPAVYQTNTGVVKLPADGSRSEIVKRLRDALK